MVAVTTVLRLPRQKMTGEVLEDKKKNGKLRDWKRKKVESLRIATAYHFLEQWLPDEFGRDSRNARAPSWENAAARAVRAQKMAARAPRSEKMEGCGAWLAFAECPMGHQRKLVNANFCRQRLCSMCSWRRALLTASQVRLVAHTALHQNPGLRFLLLTLTIPNVPGDQLGASVTGLNDSFKRLLRMPEVSRAVIGYFRAAEVKYNKKRNDYHPHLHVLIAVPARYFGDWYIEQPIWLKYWRKATGDSSITQIDVRKVKPRREGADGLAGAAAEVGKYIVTSKEVIQQDLCTTATVVGYLHKGLHRRRLTQYGRYFDKVRKQLKLCDAEKAKSKDLVSIGENSTCICEVCQSELVKHVFSWQPRTGDYIG